MFSLTPGTDPKKKKKDDPRTNQPLDSKGRKQAKQFSKGVNRFLRYNKDLLSNEKYSKVSVMRDEFLGLLEEPSTVRKEYEDRAEKISQLSPH